MDIGAGQRVTGLRAQGSPSIPQWTAFMKADCITFRSPVDGSNKTANKADIAASIHAGDFGISANMPAAMAAYSNAQLYFLYGDGQPIIGTVSANPPDMGPALPAGYTHYAFAYSVRIDANGQMPTQLTVAGNKVYFYGFPYTTVWDWVAPSIGSSPADVELWHWVPDNALETCTWWDPEYQTTSVAGQGNLGFVVLGQAPFQAYTKPSETGCFSGIILQSPTNPAMANKVQFYDGTGYAHYSKFFLGFQILSYTVANGG